MTPPTRSVRSLRRPLGFALCTLVALIAGRPAQADPLYSITDLQPQSGYTSSLAVAINNQGQVAGMALGSSGWISFLDSNGQFSQIDPIGGGGARAINDSGQVAGGSLSSINDSGQTVSSSTYINSSGQAVSSQPTAVAPAGAFVPYAINNAGEMAGLTLVPVAGSSTDSLQPAIYENGQVINLVSQLGIGATIGGNAFAINQKGDVLLSVALDNVGATVQWYLYHTSTGQATLLSVQEGQGAPLALNDKDQLVGGGTLWSNGTTQTLQSLLPQNSGWSNLQASGINDAGQIVGAGTYQGQTVAFLMTPDGIATPEPAAMTLWAGIAALVVASQAVRTTSFRRRDAIIATLGPLEPTLARLHPGPSYGLSNRIDLCWPSPGSSDGFGGLRLMDAIPPIRTSTHDLCSTPAAGADLFPPSSPSSRVGY